jgi:regulator of PEP synthase PpsR (kinase-PPPase family)
VVLYVVSDSTGNLARHMVSTFLTQFPAGAVEVRYEMFVKDVGRVEGLLAGVEGRRVAVCHAVVSRELKGGIVRACERAGVPCHDLTGAGVAFVAGVVGAEPRADLAALHRINWAYRRRVDAVEYTLAHDDGLGLDTLGEADVVLVGVSRTSKSPTCILLAEQGWRAGNVALAPGVDPPAELLALPRGRVVGLYVDPRQLAAIRHRREAAWRTSIEGYGDVEAVAEEVAWSRRLFARRGWPSLDITDQAVEETAARVVQLLGLRPCEEGERERRGRCWDQLPVVGEGGGASRHV